MTVMPLTDATQVINHLKAPQAPRGLGIYIEAVETAPERIIEHLISSTNAAVFNMHSEIPDAEVIIFDLYKRDHLPLHLNHWLHQHFGMNVFGERPVVFVDKRHPPINKYDSGRALPVPLINKCIGLAV